MWFWLDSTCTMTAFLRSWVGAGSIFSLVEPSTDVDGELADENQRAPTFLS
jgi:hypothetical protein